MSLCQIDGMRQSHPPLPPDLWLHRIFHAKSARDDGIVRRSLADIDRVIGRDRLERELLRRGYHAVENAGQIVIFCNNEPIKLLL